MNKNNYANYTYINVQLARYVRLSSSLKIRHSIADIFDKSIVLEQDFYIKDKLKRMKTQKVMTLN